MSTSKIVSHVVDVTPAIAEQWLGKNTKNRKLNERTVFRYTETMKRGEWRITGEAIQFSERGTLLNGQHRLAAIIAAEVTVPMLVVEGLPEEAILDIDTGKKRNVADLLTMRGEADGAGLGATLRKAYTILTYNRFGGLGEREAPSHTQLLAVLDEHPEIRAAVTYAHRLFDNHRWLPERSTVATLMWWLSSVDPDDAEAFFDTLTAGENLAEGSPILTLRNYLINEKTLPRHRKASSKHVSAVTIKAWNAWRKGEELRVLRWSAGGSKPEPFPQPV